jgi:transposase
MFPELLDDYIADDNPVRFIDAFVDGLDLQALGFERAVPRETGRPPYDPGDLLKLYVYGYVNRIRSSRKLETEANRNVEVMWLLGKLAPDFKTIADFRRDNGKPIRAVFREFTLLCRTLGLYGGELVAIDGSKFKAVNSRERNFTQQKLKVLRQQAEAKIARYLQELDENDAQETDSKKLTREELQEKIEWLKRRKGVYNELQQQMEESGESQISLTDPDARCMTLGANRGTEVGYNVQISVDAKHKLIVDHEVTNECNDMRQLSSMALRAKEVLGVESLEVVADRGYYNDEEIRDCTKGAIVPYIPQTNPSNSRRAGLYTKEDFRYDAENDCYRCPAGEALLYIRCGTNKHGRQMRFYATKRCKSCAVRHKCTRDKGGRRIQRWEDEGLLEEMAHRLRAEPNKVKKRKLIVEHPFGTIKRSMDQGYFLTRRLCNVRTEMSLTMLAYNIKRALMLKGTVELMAALAMRGSSLLSLAENRDSDFWRIRSANALQTALWHRVFAGAFHTVSEAGTHGYRVRNRHSCNNPLVPGDAPCPSPNNGL